MVHGRPGPHHNGFMVDPWWPHQAGAVTYPIIHVAGAIIDTDENYGTYAAAENDTFDAVNKRELELGAATMTSLVYLYDKYGLVKQIPSTLKK